MLCGSRLILEEEVGRELHKLLRLEFLKSNFVNNFVEHNISGPLNGGANSNIR